jgi:hypothetical protein
MKYNSGRGIKLALRGLDGNESENLVRKGIQQ